jgi:DNA mismatch endonuclease (patch repair protein)
MADTLTQDARRALMARIRGKDTKPELAVRRELHALGYRYRLHARGLPGSPDLVFPGRRKVIFVHGCYWHAHDCRHGLRRPSTNSVFWQGKAEANRARDRRKAEELLEAGWDVAVVWECETTGANRGAWLDRIRGFLGPPSVEAERTER